MVVCCLEIYLVQLAPYMRVAFVWKQLLESYVVGRGELVVTERLWSIESRMMIHHGGSDDSSHRAPALSMLGINISLHSFK